MIRKKIRIPKINSNEIMNELGKLEDSIEFIDLTKDDMEAKKNFANQIKRCEEMEKRIKYIFIKLFLVILIKSVKIIKKLL